MHVDDETDIMNPVIEASRDPGFGDECHAYSPGACSEQRVHCPDGGQNAHLELLAQFGPGVADDEPPEVSVIRPLDGDAFGVGADFTIEVMARDDSGITTVTLTVDGTSYHSLSAPPYVWQVRGIPAGSYTVEAKARDAAGNEGSSTPVAFTVSPDLPPQSVPGGTGGSGGEGSDGGGGGLDDAQSDTDGQGCACRMSSSRADVGWALSLLLCLCGAARPRPRKPGLRGPFRKRLSLAGRPRAA